MMTADKIEIFDILMNRGLLDNITDMIALCINDDKSFSLIEKLTDRRQIISKCLITDILLCVKLLKHKELDILLDHNIKIINEKHGGFIPIVHYFETTIVDGVEEILLLKILLKHKSILNTFNSKGDTPILHTIKNTRNEAFSLLFKNGADVCEYDADGFNCLHHAIKKNNMQILSLLKKHYADDGTHIINKLTKDQTHPLILSINSVNPIYITQMLLAEDCINCEYLYTGNNILHYIIKNNAPLKIKNTLFKNCATKQFNLLEECVSDKKPLVVKAVESDLYEIVIIIINKLLERD